MPNTKTRILLNAAPLSTVLSGVARYTRSLYTAIEAEQSAKISYFCNGHLQNTMPAQSGNPIGGSIPVWIRQILRELRFKYIQYRLNNAVREGDFTVYHETGAFPLLENGEIPTVMTLYDLSLVKFKHCHPADRVRLFERHFYKRKNIVDHFITISEFVRQEIIETLHIPPEKVTAIPLGVDEHFSRQSVSEISGYLEKNNLPKKYILTVGTHEPRKNIATLIRALAQTQENYVLVSTGWSGWLNDEFHREVSRLQMEDRVICLGHVPDEELVLLYSGARLMVYPSLYEGFGLPILEAMACGCPVICSNTSSMPEVAGDAAILVSPEDENALTEAIDDVMQNEELQHRLIEAGYHRANNFSWQETAKRTIAVFEKFN